MGEQQQTSEVYVSHFSVDHYLIRRGSAEFFVTQRELPEYEALVGKRWARRVHVHLLDGQCFRIEADGLCRACRKGGKCRRVPVSVLDISNCKLPLLRRRQAPSDEVAIRREVKDVIKGRPDRPLPPAAAEVVAKLEKLAADDWNVSPDEIRALRQSIDALPRRYGRLLGRSLRPALEPVVAREPASLDALPELQALVQSRKVELERAIERVSKLAEIDEDESLD
jgi:hypothetical protein